MSYEVLSGREQGQEFIFLQKGARFGPVKSPRFRVLASDYDMTLADGNRLDPATVEALKKARAAGIRLVLVTGRTLPYICGADGLTRDEASLFDRIVSENGAILYDPATNRAKVLGSPPAVELIRQVRELVGEDNAVVGWGSLHVPLEHAPVIADMAKRLGLHLHWIPGDNHAVFVNIGIDKASGLRAAMRELHIPMRSVVAVGNGSNDVAMVDRHRSGVGMGVAVANAVPELKAVADLVTKACCASGVRELISGLIQHTLKPREREAGGRGLSDCA